MTQIETHESPKQNDPKDKNNISKQEEEKLSQAYIQKLLKKENSYYEESNDNEYMEAHYSDFEQDDDYTEQNSYKIKPSNKKPKKEKEPKKEKYNEINEKGLRSGAYTLEEEALFLEGLNIFGRSWKLISSHVKTRDVPSVKSKAQQFFVKLFRDKKPLPQKVLETGDGYTLSGKPLDPESASARKYIHIDSSNIDKPKKSPSTNKNKASKTKKEGPLQPEFTFQSKEKSQYSISRLRNNPKKLKNQDFGDTSYVLIGCSNYAKDPVSYASNQPFSILVSNFVLGFMDVHSHLFKENEVIGLLGGSWNKDTKTINIETCYPARSTSHNEDSHLSVELDPISEVEIRDKASKENHTILGWYHSHPNFRPNPSVVDLEYQLRYQRLTKNNENLTPFVGCIISTYSNHLKGPQSQINWFCFDSNKSAYEMDSEELYKNAKKLEVTKLYKNKILRDVADEWFEFLNTLKEKTEIINMEDVWKDKLTFKDKIINSVHPKFSKDVAEAENVASYEKEPEYDTGSVYSFEDVMQKTWAFLDSATNLALNIQPNTD